MKFMVMHKSDEKMEREVMPGPELIAAVGALVQGARADGTLVDGAGLRSSARRARLTFPGGERRVERGPYAGANELLSGLAKLKVKSMDEAVEWATRLARAMGDVETEVGTVTEPWDLGVMPKPAGDVPLNVLALYKSTPATEAGAAPAAEVVAAVNAVVEEAKAAGVLGATHALAPSRKGARITGSQGARRIVDGPFAESKELVAGYMIMEFASKADAVAFGVEYADTVGAREVDVREVQ